MWRKLLLSVAGVIALVFVNAASAAVVNWSFNSGANKSATSTDGAFESTITALGSQSFTFPSGQYLRSFGGSPGDTLKLDFSQAITALSFDIGSLDNANSEAVAFNVTPTLSAASGVDWINNGPATLNGMTVSPGGINNASSRVSFTGLGGITSFIFAENSVGPRAIYYDNFTATVVPVPAAVWLFGSGVIGLLGFAKRKK